MIAYYRAAIAVLGLMMAFPLHLHAQEKVQFINPPGLLRPPGYTHVVEVPAGQRMVFISGQVPIDSAGNLIGAGNFRLQARQVFDNLRRALAAVGGDFLDVVKINYYISDNSSLKVLREIRNEYINANAPPASTLAVVKGLYRDDVLLEVEAVAVLRK